MDHESLQRKIFEFHDGELPPAERAAVETHLASCPGCRRSLEEWTRTARALLRPPRTEASEAFVRSVLRKIEDRETADTPPSGPGLFLGRLRAAFSLPRLALAGAAMLAAVFAVSPPRPPRPAAPSVQLAANPLEGGGWLEEEEDPAFGTTVEEYFL